MHSTKQAATNSTNSLLHFTTYLVRLHQYQECWDRFLGSVWWLFHVCFISCVYLCQSSPLKWVYSKGIVCIHQLCVSWGSAIMSPSPVALHPPSLSTLAVWIWPVVSPVCLQHKCTTHGPASISTGAHQLTSTTHQQPHSMWINTMHQDSQFSTAMGALRTH